MTTLDAEATFVKLDKLRARMDRLKSNPDTNEWQYTRLLIRALVEDIAKTKKSSVPVSRRIVSGVPPEVQADWDELVDILEKKGVKSIRRQSPSKT